jgi:hypothetical protein
VSEARLSAVELQYLRGTFELVLEELNGIEEATAESDYVLTVGAKEQAEDCLRMIGLKEKFLEPDAYIPLEATGE